MLGAPLLLALSLLPKPAYAGTLVLDAYDSQGRHLGLDDLLRYIGPSPATDAGPEKSALYVTDLEGRPAPGRPWWQAKSSQPVIHWEGSPRIVASLPWPVSDDGFSTVTLDANGEGYADGQRVLLNEEIASSAYRQMRESLDELAQDRNLPYKPRHEVARLLRQAKNALADAKAASEPVSRAALFDKALTAVAYAWQQALFERGKELARNSKIGSSLRWGLTLDETLLERISEQEWIFDRLQDAGVNWVRLVFRTNIKDFTYAQKLSTTFYDKAVDGLSQRGIHVMGDILDSALWPKDTTPDAYVERTRNLVTHYSGRIRSWEVANEPNGTWVGGYRHPLPDSVVIEAVTRAASEIKRIDHTLETVATLYWWEGTAKDDAHPLFAWLDWSQGRGLLENIDVIAVSVYPNDNPMGLALYPTFKKLARRFPGKTLMLGGFGFVENEKLPSYWWFQPGNLEEARKDLLNLYTGAACSLPRSVGGGFWFPTLSQMLVPGKKSTPLYRIYSRTLENLRH